MVVSMTNTDEHERKICNEFTHLVEQSKHLFNGLRDLPQCGQKIWQSYFGKTFDLFTKLWKYQQQHRSILDRKYGLKRWQIGEIASKIGQLYYHYYVRTSDLNNLFEAYAFYSAIRSRHYYYTSVEEEGAEIAIKKLRYYARFIVVCLLLKKNKLVTELLRELDMQIVHYSSTYEPDGQMEWSTVLMEVKLFLAAESVVKVLTTDLQPVILNHRMTPLNIPPVEKSSEMTLVLSEILLVGNVNDQVRYSEMTIDMFRMIQTFEREKQKEDVPFTDPLNSRSSFHSKDRGSSRYSDSLYAELPGMRRDNPHKYMLYKPTFTQLSSFLTTGFKELPTNGTLLMYVSADGSFTSIKQPCDPSYDYGGFITTNKKDSDTLSYNRPLSRGKEIHCFYPGDLTPLTRKPLFLIVDSDNSIAFRNMANHFGIPQVVLMSPTGTPSPYHGYYRNGNIFSLFLHCPLMAFCLICNITTLQLHLWERSQTYVEKFISEASRLFTRCTPDTSFTQFFGDDFLRLIILRYVFCCVVLQNHELFNAPEYRPCSMPPLPSSEFLHQHSLQSIVLELAGILEVREQFIT